MRVNRTAIRRLTFPEYDKVILKLESPFEDFLENVYITLYNQWEARELGQKYLVQRLQKNVVKFNYQYLLIESDHRDLLEVIEHLLQEFTVYSIQYATKYKELMEFFKNEVGRFDDCLVASLTSGKLFETFSFYYHQGSPHAQEIEYLINRLSEFREETLVYTIQQSDVKAKLSIRNRNINRNDIDIFLSELVKLYGGSIPKYVSESMSKIGLEGSVIIQKVDYFVDLEKLAELKIDIKSLSGQCCGLIFITFGYQESYCKLHKFIENWLEKLSITVMEVDALQCCKKDQLSTYFEATYHGSHAVALPLCSRDQSQRILLFDPPKDARSTADLHHFFKSTNRIISGLQFPNCQFSLLHEHWDEFVNASNLSLRTRIYEDYLIINCTRGQEVKLREKIKDFLEERVYEEVKTSQFLTPFEISLFHAIYRRQISIKNSRFFMSNGSLFRQNFVKDSEELDKKLRELYQQMKKSLVFVPISSSLPVKKDYFLESQAAEWEDPECLQGQQFKIEKKVTVNIRCFASIASNEEDCFFIVEDVKLCTELLNILKEEETANIEKKLAQNPVLGFSLRYCKAFNSITACTVMIRNDRQTKWVRRLKETFEQLISSHQSSRHIKFMFHKGSLEAVKFIVPIVIDCVRNNCNLRAECKLKEVTFFTSSDGGQELRAAIVGRLKEVRERNGSIVRICELSLRASEVEKIIAYGYYSLKYFENEQTREASPLNSFIFYSELKKKKKTPIFLPSSKEKASSRRVEYLVSCFNETVYKVIGRRIQKVILNNARLNALKSIMKKYFPTIEYFVTCGDMEGSYFCSRLFYTSTEQKHYKCLEKAGVDVEGEKIVVQKEFLRYQIIKNQFLHLKRIETHSSKVPELLALLDGAVLM